MSPIKTSSESLTLAQLELNGLNRALINIDRRLQKIEADILKLTARLATLEAAK